MTQRLERATEPWLKMMKSVSLAEWLWQLPAIQVYLDQIEGARISKTPNYNKSFRLSPIWRRIGWRTSVVAEIHYEKVVKPAQKHSIHTPSLQLTMTRCIEMKKTAYQLMKCMKNTSTNWTRKLNDITSSLVTKETNIWRSSVDSERKLLEWHWNTSGIILLGIENPDQLDEKGGNIYKKQGSMHKIGQHDTSQCRTDQDEKQGSKWVNTTILASSVLSSWPS